MKNYILNYVLRRVPTKLLLLLRENSYETINQAIVRRVIFDLVLTDLNLVGGRSLTINARDCIIRQVDSDTIILEVPASIREYSNITSVQFIQDNSYDDNIDSRLSVGRRTRSIYDGIRAVNNVSSYTTDTDIMVVGNKFIHVRQDGIDASMISNSKIHLEVAYSTAFEGINSAYYPEFGEIAKYGAQMLIYNMELDIDEITANSPVFNDRLLAKVASYDNAINDYQDSLDVMGKLSFLNDRSKMESLIGFSI